MVINFALTFNPLALHLSNTPELLYEMRAELWALRHQHGCNDQIEIDVSVHEWVSAQR